MPLILAIEPDRKQASQLTAMVRGRLHAEFVLGESAERALAALGERVPDLILTSALLSPKDETALGERLRALNGAAAHVQTLTIPVLASPNGLVHSGGRVGGMLAALRREKTKPSAPDGCDPAVFAEQCKEYLERADTERTLIEEQAAAAEAASVEPAAATPDVPDAVAVAEVVAAPVAPSVQAQPAREPEFREVLAVPPDDAEGPASLLAAVAALAAEEEVAAADVPHTEPREDETRHYQFIDLDLSDLLDGPGSAAARAAKEQEENEDAIQIYELDPASLNVDLEASAEPMLAAAPEDEPQPTVSETELYSPLSRSVSLRWPTLAVAGEPPRPVAVSDEPDEMKEWLDIIEALRRDAAQVPIMRSATPPPPDSERPDAAGKKKRKRPLNAPAQDEWGFFDPEQCGFQALIAKLEEITEQDDTQTPRA